MGFAVLHIQKSKGNDSGTTAHIERTVSPANADPERTHLNKEFIPFPEDIQTRTQAIQHRIENARIKCKISYNQVRALQIMLSGMPEDMQRIQLTGKLDKWCNDNIEWLQETFGNDNLVSAVLHMDEKTSYTRYRRAYRYREKEKGQRNQAGASKPMGAKKTRIPSGYVLTIS